MWIAFLSALLDPVVVGAALLGVFFVRRAWQLRLGVASVAAALSLTELIGGAQEPLGKVFASAAGAGAGGLLIAEAVRFIVAPMVALFIAGAIYAVCGLKNRGKTETGAPEPPSPDHQK